MFDREPQTDRMKTALKIKVPGAINCRRYRESARARLTFLIEQLATFWMMIQLAELDAVKS